MSVLTQQWAGLQPALMDLASHGFWDNRSAAAGRCACAQHSQQLLIWALLRIRACPGQHQCNNCLLGPTLLHTPHELIQDPCRFEPFYSGALFSIVWSAMAFRQRSSCYCMVRFLCQCSAGISRKISPCQELCEKACSMALKLSNLCSCSRGSCLRLCLWQCFLPSLSYGFLP